ncbi:adhesin protein Mad1 [Plectosphaerella cucumerina]|uniref:Adhesin protein Mad1 n=1 Tax=Plectosphaerella cucumerina TaxID=40658 RepID=A0A8K0X2X6_9PEZI|nr:adhesin protein Mad1 [Plectosphaerella cucumerina]
MKSSLAILALASVGEATFNFRGAKPFTCPDNVDNSCVEKQKNGFDFKDLFPGKFNKYNDFDFKGWSCEDKFNKRIIKGECGSTKEESPSFGHYENPFSVDHIDVTPEEDTDLEFHYDMPDGSSCKTRSSCSSQGTTVKNNQCGGAKKVTIVYPPRPNKKTCKIDVGKIGFGCDKTKFPPPPPVYPPPSVPSPSTLSTVVAVPSTSAPAPSVPAPSEPVYSEPVFSQPPVQSEPPVVVVPSSSAPASSAPASSAPASSAPASSAPPQQETSPAVSSSAIESTTSEAIPVQSEPVQSEPVYSQPGYSQPPPAETEPVVEEPSSSAPAQITSSAVESTTTGVIPVQSEPVYSQPPVISEPPVVETTVFQSTSTIFTTSVTTVTDCGPEKPECGGQETPVVVTVTVPQTTTVCDVTSTFTRPAVPTTDKPALPQTTVYPESPETPETPEVPETPEEPETELPCDPVVPRCLITWLPLVPDCKDNTDAKCFCPKKEFIDKVFECLYAYGDNDEVVDKALKFVQGICADHVNENPAIVTGGEVITKILTLPPATATSVAYTTVTLDATLTVPCVENGVTLSESLTTTVVKSTIEVPKVEFATTASDIIPVVPTAIPIQEGEGNKPTLIVAPSSTPAGTGGIVPVPTSGLPVAAGAGKLSAGVAAAVAVMVAMAAF